MIHFGLETSLPLLLYVGMFAAFVLSMFWRPTLGIYLLTLSLPLQTGRYKLQVYPLGSQFIDILLLGTILGLLIRGKFDIPKTGLNGILILLVVFSYFSLWEGSYFLHAPLPLWVGDDRFSTWKNYVEMFLFALVIAAAIKDKKQIQLLLLVMAVSVLLVNRSFYHTMSGRDLSHFSDEIRDAGPLGYAGVNGFAAFEAMVASFLLGILPFTRKVYAKAGILLLLATCCYCVLFSFSRGAYIGLLVGLVVVGLLKTRWFLAVAAVIVLGWQTLLPVAVQERITMTTADAAQGQRFETSAEERILLWQDAMDSFERNPLTGTGFQTFGAVARVGGLRDTHNYYFKVLAEMGLVGMVIFLVLLWKLLRTGTNLFFGTEDPFWRALGLGFIALFVSIVVMNFFGDRWTYQQLDGFLWVLLGCTIRGTIAIRESAEQALPGSAPAVSLEEPGLAAV